MMWMVSENYGFMVFVKVVFDLFLVFLVKSFSWFLEVCFNVVVLLFLKIFVLVGIFGYVDVYFFVE